MPLILKARTFLTVQELAEFFNNNVGDPAKFVQSYCDNDGHHVLLYLEKP